MVTAHLDQRDRIVEVVRIIEKRVGAPTAAECLVDHSPPPPTRDEAIAAVFTRDPAGRLIRRPPSELDRFRDGSNLLGPRRQSDVHPIWRGGGERPTSEQGAQLLGAGSPLGERRLLPWSAAAGGRAGGPRCRPREWLGRRRCAYAQEPIEPSPSSRRTTPCFQRALSRSR